METGSVRIVEQASEAIPDFPEAPAEALLSSHRVKVFLGLAVLVAAMGYFAFQAFQSASVYYLTVGELQQELFGTINRPLSREELRRGEGELVGDRGAQLSRQIGHPLGVGDAVAIDPAEDLARAKALVPSLFDCVFKCRSFQLGEVELVGHGRHGMSHVRKNLPNS